MKDSIEGKGPKVLATEEEILDAIKEKKVYGRLVPTENSGYGVRRPMAAFQRVLFPTESQVVMRSDDISFIDNTSHLANFKQSLTAICIEFEEVDCEDFSTSLRIKVTPKDGVSPNYIDFNFNTDGSFNKAVSL